MRPKDEIIEGISKEYLQSNRMGVEGRYKDFSPSEQIQLGLLEVLIDIRDIAFRKVDEGVVHVYPLDNPKS